MAIKRLDPTAIFKVVSRYDDAIDHEGDEGSARWEAYLDNFDLSTLKFKEGQKPTLFHVRCLKSHEQAMINEKYIVVDTINKRATYKSQNAMMIELFNLCCLGVENEETQVEKVTADEIPFHTAVEIGSIISLMTTVGKNLKKA